MAKKKEKEYEGTGKVDVKLLKPEHYDVPQPSNYPAPPVLEEGELVAPHVAAPSPKPMGVNELLKAHRAAKKPLMARRRKPGEFKGNPSRCEDCGGSMTKGVCGRCGKVMP